MRERTHRALLLAAQQHEQAAEHGRRCSRGDQEIEVISHLRSLESVLSVDMT
jgi:hypothetical protein